MKQVLRRWLAGLLSVIMLFGLLPSSVYATPSAGFTSAESGSGRDSDPYIIASADQLAALSAFVNSGESCSGLYFRLEGDIKLEGSADHQWTPIGKDYDNQFMGSFDGDGHTISGLYIDSTSNYQGLFGAIGSDGIVKNLAVSGSVTGNNYVGGIAGYSVGIIENCHNDASITGNSIVGGIAGDVYAGTIQKCYNRGTISGSANVGGIAGSLNGSIQNCYNLGEINSSETAGGIAGFILAAQFTNCYNTGNITSDISYMAGSIAGGDSVFTNCYFLQGTAAYSIGGGGSSNEVHEKTAEEFFTLASVLNGSGSSETWKDEPFLGHPVLVENPELVNISGDGTADEPYLIPDLETLELVRTYVDSGQSKGKYFKLTSSIDMSEKYNAETSTSWIPIGSRDNSFQGTFDGGNNKINNLYIDNPKSALGLFGAIGESGKVKNLTVDGYIFGGAEWKIGGLAGECQGSIENCHSSVDITNGSAVGGIAGLVTESAIVTGCTNSGSIISTGNVAGGIAGSMGNNSTIQNCYNTGEVNTFEKSGGIVGEMSSTSTVTDCYNTGAITGFNYVGGIVGTRSNGDVSCCYNTGDIADYANVGGIVGLSEDGTTTNCYYLDSVCSDNGQGTQKSEAAFTSGEVAWLLQNGQDPQVWGQGLKGSSDEYPVLTTDTNKKVYKVTFQAGDEEYDVKYANPGGVKELPTNPSVVGMVFDHWSTENLATEEDVFTENTPVTGDITVYAVGKHTFGGDDADIPVGVVYGYDTPQTVDLDKHMEYQNGSPVTDKFQYEIENDGGATGAEINNNTLTIPIGLNAGEYTIKVKATEKDPFALMSVSSFDTEPVTLTIKVTVSPATISFTLNQTEATYTGTSLKDTIINAVKQTADENPKIEPSGYSVSFKQGDVVIEDPTDVGTYEVWVTITDPNFQFAVGSTEQKVRDFTINKGTATVTPDAVSPITYGEPVTIKVTITPNPFTNATQPDPITDKVEFAFKKGGSVSSTVSDEGTATITIKPDEVKNYFSIGSNEVTIHYNGNKNLNPSTNASVAVTVNQKQLEFAFDANNKTYDGSKEVKGTLTMKTPRVGNDDVTATYTATAESADVGNAIGVTVDVTLSGHDAAYYEAVNPTGVTVDISKASVSGVTLPAAKTNLVYSGALQDLIEAGSCEEGTMQYALGTETSATDSYSAVIPTATDAGTYYVWYKVVGDGNHSDTDPEKIQVTIAQKVVTLTWKLDGGDNFAATYTGSAHTVTATADGLVAADLPEGVKIELSGNTATDPGNYSAKAVLTGSRASNYKLLNSTRPYSIGMHASSVTVSVSENPTYGSDITLTATVTASGIDGSLITGALTFQANGENLGAGTSDGNGSWSLTIPGTDRTAQKALFGSNGLDVSIAAAYAGNGNIAASSGTATASIAKRTLTYTVTAAGRTYDGTTVIQVTLKPADLLGGDNVSLTATGNVEKADANSYSTVDLNNIALSGDDARFYSAAAEAQDHALSTPVVIKPIEVTLQCKLDAEDALPIPYEQTAILSRKLGPIPLWQSDSPAPAQTTTNCRCQIPQRPSRSPARPWKPSPRLSLPQILSTTALHKHFSPAAQAISPREQPSCTTEVRTETVPPRLAMKTAGATWRASQPPMPAPTRSGTR